MVGKRRMFCGVNRGNLACCTTRFGVSINQNIKCSWRVWNIYIAVSIGIENGKKVKNYVSRQRVEICRTKRHAEHVERSKRKEK